MNLNGNISKEMSETEESLPSFPSPQQFERVLTSAAFENLEKWGYAVADGVFGKEWTRIFRDEIKLLYEQQLLHSNKTYYEGSSIFK